MSGCLHGRTLLAVLVLWCEVTEDILDIQVFEIGYKIFIEEIFQGDVEEGYEHDGVD